tara:strand:+ start:570 stop:1175 length:606 start_codon:yes stop_codon:yes gene_type:complete
MFRRRVRPPIIDVLTSFFWPKAGLKRGYKYMWHRVNRLPGGAYSISAGLASGCAMSFTPLVGLHFIIAAVLAWLIRGNVMASVFGTFVGNPWTFPIMWLGTYKLGNFILGNFSVDEPLNASFVEMYASLLRSMITADTDLFLFNVWPVLWPMLVGSIPISVLTWIFVYFIFYRFVEAYQLRRNKKTIKLAEESKDQHQLPL